MIGALCLGTRLAIRRSTELVMQRIYMTVFVLIASGVPVLATPQDRVAKEPASSGEVPKPFHFLVEGSIGDLNAAWANLPFDRITFERTTCFGACPAYKVTFYRGAPKSGRNESYADRFGRAELNVTRTSLRDKYFPHFPEAVGNFEGWVDISTFARLSYLIQNSGLHLRDRYVAGWTDSASTIVSVSGPGISKTILDYGGVGPIELWGIQESIDSAAKSVAWKRR